MKRCRLFEGLLVALCCVSVLGQTSGPSNGPIRLWRSGTTSVTYTSGIVQLLYNSRWGNICDESGNFGVAEASVVCHQLGYTRAFNFYKINSTSSDEFGTDTSPAVLSDVRCSNSTYLVILQCDFITTPSSSCTDNHDVSVMCFPARIWDSPFYSQIRLTRGNSVNQGLVEVFCAERWGTICDDHFGQNDADTVCRQLGYASAYRYDHLPYRGSRTQPILLDSVPCSSPQACIAHCTRCPSTLSGVDDDCKDVTIECHSPTRYTGTTIDTCRSTVNELVGIIVGGVLGGIILLVIAVVIIVLLVNYLRGFLSS